MELLILFGLLLLLCNTVLKPRGMLNLGRKKKTFSSSQTVSIFLAKVHKIFKFLFNICYLQVSNNT